MREALKNIDGTRSRFSGTFVRYGSKKSYKGWPVRTILLNDLKNAAGQVMTDHIWFTANKQFDQFDLQPGDILSFNARVKPYIKGYRGRRDDEGSSIQMDYKLSHPNNIKCSKPAPSPQQKLF